MKGKSIISILIGVVLIIIGLILLFGGNSDNNTSPSNTTESNSTNVPSEQGGSNLIAKIFVYNPNGLDIIKTVDITDQTKGNELQTYIVQLQPLPVNEQVNLELIKTIEIKYGNDVIVGIQNGEDRYCDYSTDGGTVFTKSYMPVGLVDWLKANGI